MKQLIECVPNISEGRNTVTIEQLKQTIIEVEGVKLLHTDIGYSANRTVFTFAGTPESIVEAAYCLIQKASQLINMEKHTGTHPRIGAVDVCPLVPIAGITMDETVIYAKMLADRVGEELHLPIYCYGYASGSEGRFHLENIRRGQYEGLKEKMVKTEWKPDYGTSEFNARFGAMAIGARNYLIAFNVNLDTKDISVAREIAEEIRESGYLMKGTTDIKKVSVRIPGKLKAVKAIGWYADEFNCSQVSTNIIDYKTTSIYTVFETIVESAHRRNIEVTGSEIIGMVPLNSIILTCETIEKAIVFLNDKENDDLLIEVQNKLGLILKNNGRFREKILENSMPDLFF